MEDEEGDHIVSYSLKKTDQYPRFIYSSQGLLGYLALNSKDRKLAWIEWENTSIRIVQNKWTIKAEIAFPQWVLGMSSFSCVGDDVVGAFAQEGIWTLALFQENGSIKILDQPFIEFSGLHSYQNRLVAIASSSEITEGIFEIDLLDNSWEHTPASTFSLAPDEISVGESFWFIGSNEENVHAWYYPPLDKQIFLPP